MAAKFPTRACPKCGKPIHIKSRTHDCGWKAAPAAASPAKGAGKSISKLQAVRNILDEKGNDLKPGEIQDMVKKKFKLSLDPATISNYKSSILREGTRKRKPGRPKGTAAVSRSASGHTISIEDIKTVKALADRIGIDRLRQLAELVSR